MKDILKPFSCLAFSCIDSQYNGVYFPFQMGLFAVNRNPSHICNLCNEEFLGEGPLVSHFNSEHMKLDKNSSAMSEGFLQSFGGRHMCCLCTKMFKQRHRALDHLRGKHGIGGSFTCECGMRFGNRESQRQHRIICRTWVEVSKD